MQTTFHDTGPPHALANLLAKTHALKIGHPAKVNITGIAFDSAAAVDEITGVKTA